MKQAYEVKEEAQAHQRVEVTSAIDKASKKGVYCVLVPFWPRKDVFDELLTRGYRVDSDGHDVRISWGHAKSPEE